ncbi:PAQR family membrane homeostasis protein TrhA [Reichenbachiella versicolor]|uniref:PAQR family membrane homeostasis protein TrhA n=1 Tax=Reichenbachiella versicolor TaxID=1821036 RepID=UPI000D6E81A5|nr:hemolysin III family protein [Reichenbachiella versicolor]
MSKHPQTKFEEIFNSISHGVTALLAIAGLVILIVLGAQSQKEWSLFSALIYGISLVVLYTFSTLYHSLTNKTAKKVFEVLDHIGIFLLIAGTYTPIVVMSIGGTVGWTFFGIQWGLAAVGIVLKIFLTGKYNLLSTLLYAAMGWSIMVRLDALNVALSEEPYWLLVAGGLSYTIGIIFYIIDYRMKLAHFIWHLFVTAGSLLHYVMMVVYII